MHRINPAQPRGIAMLLVLVSLAMATIITSAYLASRDNSTVIGANVASAAAARWTALSGLELAVAIMETDSDWRTSAVNGKLLDDYALGDGALDLDLLDIETNAPPTAISEDIRLTVRAWVNGVDETATAVLHVPIAKAKAVDVDLREFAVFASEKIALENRATLARWPMSPLSALGKRVAVGTNAIASSSIDVQGDAASIDTTVYTGPSASQSLIKNASAQAIEQQPLLDDIPLPASPDSGVRAPLEEDAVNFSTNYRTGGYVQVTSDLRELDILLTNSAMSHWVGDITVVSNTDFKLDSGSTLVVDGNAKLVVFEDLLLANNSSIVLRPGATLEIYVGDKLDINDSFVGEYPAPAGGVYDISGSSSWIDPARIQVFSIQDAVDLPKWELRGNSVLKGSIYAPNLDSLDVRQNSALYGRAAAQQVTVKDDGAIYYDHVLDSGYGYTNPKSKLFDKLGHIKDAFRSLASLNSADLNAAVSATDTSITLNGDVYGTPEEEANVQVVAGEPTPRTVEVDYDIMSYGSAVADWETAIATVEVVAK